MRTVLDIYKAYLHDANKEEAPTLYPSDFNHFLMKAINQYCNKNYSFYDMIQQKTDDLRALSTFKKVTEDGKVFDKLNELGTLTIEKVPFGISLPLFDDYWHILSCIVDLDTGKKDCDGNSIIVQVDTKRTTADKFLSIRDDYFQRPSLRRVYHYIQGNNIELRFGNKGTLKSVYIDYLKTHSTYTLTPDQIEEFENTGIDTSQEMEFSSYVNYEILRELNTLVLARDSDPRIQTIPQVTQSIIN